MSIRSISQRVDEESGRSAEQDAARLPVDNGPSRGSAVSSVAGGPETSARGASGLVARLRAWMAENERRYRSSPPGPCCNGRR